MYICMGIYVYLRGIRKILYVYLKSGVKSENLQMASGAISETLYIHFEDFMFCGFFWYVKTSIILFLSKFKNSILVGLNQRINFKHYFFFQIW